MIKSERRPRWPFRKNNDIIRGQYININSLAICQFSFYKRENGTLIGPIWPHFMEAMLVYCKPYGGSIFLLNKKCIAERGFCNGAKVGGVYS